MVEVGVLYARGSMPLYEDFGFLPTKLVYKPEDFNDLSMLIIPPGCIVESRGLDTGVSGCINRFIGDGGLVLGVCSGLQLLSRGVYTGYRFIGGLGYIDVVFRRLVALDFAAAIVRRPTWLTRGLVGCRLRCMHIHTYGEALGGAPVILESILPRHNYFGGRVAISSGFGCEYENVVGVLPHFLLDYNSSVRENVLRELGFPRENVLFEKNRFFRRRVLELLATTWGFGGEVCISGGCTRVLAVASSETSDGKTLVTTALACGLRRLGYRVCVAKLGGDLRDLHPPIYILGSRMNPLMGLAVGGSRGVYGWSSFGEYYKTYSRACDFMIIEGVMGVLTGSCRRKCFGKPCSTLEFLVENRIPTVLVVSCDKGGVEDAVEKTLLYTRVLRDAGVKLLAVVLNKYYGGKNEDAYVSRRLSSLEAPIYKIPTLGAGEKTLTPEIDLDVHSLCKLACRVAEEHINVREIANKTPCYHEI